MTILDSTFGALLIGIVVSATLYGVTCIQTWYYYVSYPADPLHIKLLVAAVFVSDTCHQALVTHCGYTYLVTDIAFPEGLGEVVWSLIVEVFFNAFTALMVQSFLTMRVYKLSNRSWTIALFIMIFVIGEFLMVLVYGGKAVHFETFTQLDTLKSLSMAVNATAAVGDILIAGFLCTMLHRSRTGFRRSDTMISKLIMFSINTGLLTSICAVGSLVSISAWPGTFIYIGFYFSLGRLYCNSLLATLNARNRLRSGERSEDLSLSLQGIHQKTTTQSATGTIPKRAPNNISIKIDTTQEFARDELSASTDVKSRDVGELA